MRKKVLIALGAFAALVVIFVIVVAMQPSTFRISRSATMAAPAAAIFPHINELKKWQPWSPWMKLDPNAKSTFEGPAGGKGAAMTWAGNNEVGEGKMTIIESKPNELVRFQLEFYKPMAGVSEAEFTFKPEGEQTTVTWAMSGTNDFIGRAMCLIMDMDKMVGGQFESGLASIKAIVDTPSKP
ncbi:MAG: SRPBCC family protein [Verrucomicrobia bacterium]|nr:SRPBCC family protein [Verrucomicrobiota bacterium]